MKSAAFAVFVNEFTGLFTAEAALIGASKWILVLDVTNKAFLKLVEGRYMEAAAKPIMKMKPARKEMDA